MNQSVYIIMAGSNGAGKSTFREVIEGKLKGISIVDPDYIAKSITGDEKYRNGQAAKKAIELMKYNFSNKIDFLQETTLSGNLNNNITLAKLQGYRTELIYIAIPSVDFAKDNIKERVLLGGHNIPDADVERRFSKSYENLVKLSSRVDSVTIIDNSNKDFKPILNLEKGKIMMKESVPLWLNETVEKVISSAKDYKNEKIFNVNERQYNKLLKDKLVKPNPFANGNKIAVLAQGKDIIKVIEKMMDFYMDR